MTIKVKATDPFYGAELIEDEPELDDDGQPVKLSEVDKVRRDLDLITERVAKYTDDPHASTAMLADALLEKQRAEMMVKAAIRKEAARAYQDALAYRDACDGEVAVCIREFGRRQSDMARLNEEWKFGVFNQNTVSDEDIERRGKYAGAYETCRLYVLRAQTHAETARDSRHEANARVANAKKALDRILDSK